MPTTDSESVRFRLENAAPPQLAALCGAGNRVLNRIESFFSVHIEGRPGDWRIAGAKAAQARDALAALARKAARGALSDVDIEGALRDAAAQDEVAVDASSAGEAVLVAGRRQVRGKTPNQRRYLDAMRNHTLTIAVGPAGSGKTWLAVAAAVAALLAHEVGRIILTRPAVEAGERLGFLPGDLQQKVDPYLRPLFDALADMVGIERMNALIEQGRIEIAPLAYMRGRTLNDAFVILDEAQNTTREQMKMFLTRLGFGSKMVVTGDVTQVDLPQHHHSGLLHALAVLEGVEDVAICRLGRGDVVRHRLVERIVHAYETHHTAQGDE
ncbi:MAG: PhoH family protein [Mariprofundaceae bacterium]